MRYYELNSGTFLSVNGIFASTGDAERAACSLNDFSLSSLRAFGEDNDV